MALLANITPQKTARVRTLVSVDQKDKMVAKAELDDNSGDVSLTDESEDEVTDEEYDELELMSVNQLTQKSLSENNRLNKMKVEYHSTLRAWKEGMGWLYEAVEEVQDEEEQGIYFKVWDAFMTLYNERNNELMARTSPYLNEDKTVGEHIKNMMSDFTAVLSLPSKIRESKALVQKYNDSLAEKREMEAKALFQAKMAKEEAKHNRKIEKNKQALKSATKRSRKSR